MPTIKSFIADSIYDVVSFLLLFGWKCGQGQAPAGRLRGEFNQYESSMSMLAQLCEVMYVIEGFSPSFATLIFDINRI